MQVCENNNMSFDLESFNVGPKRARSFVHLHEPRNIQGFKQLCRTIGASVCFTQVSGLLLEALRELEDVMLDETLFVFNNVISGLESPSSKDCQESLKEVLECYLSLVKKRDQEELIEGVGLLCQKLGEKVDIGLMIGILVCSVRTEDPDIRASLHHSLAAIVDTRRLTVRTLMEENLDLLYTDLNIKLRRRDCLSHFGVRMMIGLVMRTASRDQKMTELQDTMEILLKHLATADEEATLQILIIVQEFVRCMARRMESDNIAGAIED